MARKKKPFIDKKNATTYHLFHRSQRDKASLSSESSSVLFPSKVDMTILEKKLETIGVIENNNEVSSSYNYSKHLKPIRGGSVYYSAEGKMERDYKASEYTENSDYENIEEVPRQLESIMLSADCIEEEIAHALFDTVEEGEYEEILDDFCITANEEPEEEEEEEIVDVVNFDYEAHIRMMLQKASSSTTNYSNDQLYRENPDDIFFKGMKSLKMIKEEEEAYDDIDTLKSKETNTRFEDVLLEYESDEVGDLENDRDEIQGFRSLEGDIQVETALDEFLQKK